MYAQLDRIEDGKWAVMILHGQVAESFDIPLRMLPSGASPGDIYRVDFELDAAKTKRAVSESGSLMDGLLAEEHGNDEAERQG